MFMLQNGENKRKENRGGKGDNEMAVDFTQLIFVFK